MLAHRAAERLERAMTTSLYLLIAVLVGAGAATQSALLAAMGQHNGAYKAPPARRAG